MPPEPGERPGHKWTKFEKHVLLCLIVKNIHITGIILEPEEDVSARDKKRLSQRNRTQGGLEVSEKVAHMDVATMLNEQCNSGNYENDIDFIDVSNMIHQLIDNNKAALKYMLRNNKGRVTRIMRQVWNRGLNFSGTQKEWAAGRKEAEQEKQNLRMLAHPEGFDANTSAWEANLSTDVITARNTASNVGDGWGLNPAATTVRTDSWAADVSVLAAATGTDDPWSTSGPSEALQDAANLFHAISQSLPTSTTPGPAVDLWGEPSMSVASHTQQGVFAASSALQDAINVDAGQSHTTDAHDLWGPPIKTPLPVSSTSQWGIADVSESTSVQFAHDPWADAPAVSSASDEDQHASPMVPIGPQMSTSATSQAVEPWGMIHIHTPGNINPALLSEGSKEILDPKSIAASDPQVLMSLERRQPEMRFSNQNSFSIQPPIVGGASTFETNTSTSSVHSENADPWATPHETSKAETAGKANIGSELMTNKTSVIQEDPYAHLDYYANTMLPGSDQWGTGSETPVHYPLVGGSWQDSAPTMAGDGISTQPLGARPDITMEGLNPERAAMLAAAIPQKDSTSEGRDASRGQSGADEMDWQSYGVPPKVKGGNSEALPFNRLERR